MDTPVADQVTTKDRRDSMHKIRNLLHGVRKELASTPGPLLDVMVRNFKVKTAVIAALPALRHFKINIMQVSELDKFLDIKDLVEIHNFTRHILALWEIQENLNRDMQAFKHNLDALKASVPRDSDDIGIAIAEAHEFMIFAHFANEMQLEEELTEYSLAIAAIRDDSGFLEGTQFLEGLKVAYAVQTELRGHRSGHNANPTVSSPVGLSETTLRIIREWYRHQETHMEPDEKEKREICQYPLISFDKLVTWFTNARRRILSDKLTIRPALKIIIQGTSIKQRSNLKASGFKYSLESEYGQEEHQLVREVTKAIISELEDIASTVPFKKFAPFKMQPSKSPIYGTYWISNNTDPFTEQIQILLKAMYHSFAEAARLSMKVYLQLRYVDPYQQYSRAMDATKGFQAAYLLGTMVFFGALRLNEASYFFKPQNIGPIETKRTQAVSGNTPGIEPKLPAEGAKPGQKRRADTTEDDDKALKVPRLSESLEKYENGTFSAGLFEAVFNALRGLNDAEETYLSEFIGLSVDVVRSWFKHRSNCAV